MKEETAHVQQHRFLDESWLKMKTVYWVPASLGQCLRILVHDLFFLSRLSSPEIINYTANIPYPWLLYGVHSR